MKACALKKALFFQNLNKKHFQLKNMIQNHKINLNHLEFDFKCLFENLNKIKKNKIENITQIN